MSSKTVPVLALDGPSGSGKGTVGQLCAQQLGWHYLDSGALYRGLAWSVDRVGLDQDEVAEIVTLAGDLRVECIPNPPDTAQVLVHGESVGEGLRTEELGRLASHLAANPQVRQALLKLQRRARQTPGLVADGRDMGTVVFPDASLKVFLTASPEERAQRRYNQLKLKGFDVNLAALFETIRERDARDSQRAASPLVPATDAIMLDTSDLAIDEVVSRVLDLLQPKLDVGRANSHRA